MNALPINADELLNGLVVEWERLEFKTGWNPQDITRTICAFANDVNNWGGGYIIIGVEEQQGKPNFPPIGVSTGKVDAIQKDLLQIGHRMRPNYHPIVVPVTYQGKCIVVIWCPGGQNRPYQAPGSLGKGDNNYAYFIRRNSSTVKATPTDLQHLYEIANNVPFDDRICHSASISNLNLGLIREFLSDVKSDLLIRLGQTPLEQLCQQMQIVQGPPEYLKPLNIGLLMFCENPEVFFPCARIELVEFHDKTGDSFSEKIFKGPIHVQLRDCLRYLQSMYLREEVRKRPNRAEADRFYNYPYIAIEEALANAVYHKDYGQREPIEIRIHPDRLEILSFPGPMPPLRAQDLNTGSAKVRTYRNRRIGDFLKELHLTEGRCTGVPKIKKAMLDNGSPPPLFETDDNQSYFLATLPIQPASSHQVPTKTHQSTAKTHQPTAKTHQSIEVSTNFKIPKTLLNRIASLPKRPNSQELRSVIYDLCSWQPLTAHQLTKILGKKDKKHLVRHHLTPMIEEKRLAYKKAQSPHSSIQMYTSI